MQMGVLGRALCFCSRAVCSIPSVDQFSRGARQWIAKGATVTPTVRSLLEKKEPEAKAS